MPWALGYLEGSWLSRINNKLESSTGLPIQTLPANDIIPSASQLSVPVWRVLRQLTYKKEKVMEFQPTLRHSTVVEHCGSRECTRMLLVSWRLGSKETGRVCTSHLSLATTKYLIRSRLREGRVSFGPTFPSYMVQYGGWGRGRRQLPHCVCSQEAESGRGLCSAPAYSPIFIQSRTSTGILFTCRVGFPTSVTLIQITPCRYAQSIIYVEILNPTKSAVKTNHLWG